MIARIPQTTARVALRPLCPTDLPRLHRWRTDPVTARYCGWDTPDFATLGRTEGRYLPAVMDPEGAGAWHYVIETGDGPAGLITQDRQDPHTASCRLEILLEARAWGKGIGSEALGRILSLLFGAGEMRRVWVEVNAENARALRFFRRAGFREDGRLREAERFEGRWVDTVLLSLLASEWQRQRDPATWSVGHLHLHESAWFQRMGTATGCEPWEVALFLESDEVLVWRRDDTPAGMVSLAWRPDEVEIHLLGVDPAFRRQGLATTMLEEVRRRALTRGIRRVKLITSNDNAPAITLYQRIGFRMTALYAGRPEQRRGCVRPGVGGIPVRDDIEMTWDI